ncbi:ribonuclease HI [Agromyces terreus]|uniref:Ribonuclease H n=1 Tax=Agromyces terreus TaxID=424795 RepID=A0A9X2KG55_9MICO|nr:ribonuclease H [Agromyces terreus]MCP2372492.1 ribonuclease HI [Agromyces terreus]
MITAAADGSALGNPGPAGWAWYVDDDRWAAGGWKHATNNQGELRAVLELFRATAHLDEELLVLCDSQYVINCITKWMQGWKRKGWRKADGKPVLNVELLKELDAELAGRRYRFEWVKGHVGHPMNEAADIRARSVAEAYRSGGAVPSGPGWSDAGGTRTAARAGATSSAADDIETGLAAASALDPTPAGPTDAVPQDDDALFTLDDAPDAWHQLTVELSTEEHDRLLQLARASGVSPEEYLRGLI